MKDLSKDAATRRRIGEEASGQRVDNYLLKILKGVPKSHVYRILRSGEVRVNSRRAKPHYRLQPGDELRVPPVRTAASGGTVAPRPNPLLEAALLFEDEFLLALDKPAGIAVHGGSGVSFGVIEQFRAQRPQTRFLELVHRLDRDTSGVLLLAKKRSALTALHHQLREGLVRKIYSVLVKGRWPNARQSVRLNLHKYVTGAGERRVAVHPAGQESHTIFELERAGKEFSLLRAELKTGRTHQIRVHLAHLGFPIAGDAKYGDAALNQRLARGGLKRMFLHASRIDFEHPGTGATLSLEAPLPPQLQNFLGDI